MAEIKSANPKAFETLTNRLKELASFQTKVGWFEDSKYENGTPVAYVAAIQELGFPAGKIPPRPFMRPTVIEQKNAWSEATKVVAARVLAGKMTAQQAMDTLGGIAEGDVLKKIKSITTPPLKPSTLRARRARGNNSTKPLVDTTLMVDTLTHKTESV
jgi:hypothetical protein